MRSLSWLLACSACYSPRAQTGAPCQTDADCPTSQVCAMATRTCEREDVACHGCDGGVGVDGGADAPSGDAAPAGCWAAWHAGTQTFGTPRPIVELNSSLVEGNPSLTADLLTIYFQRGSDIYVAVRLSHSDPFGAPMRVVELDDAAENTRLASSADGTVAVFASRRAGGQGQADLWHTRRTSPAQPWQIPGQTAVAALLDADSQLDPELSDDGLRVYYAQSVPGGQTLRMATRASVDDAFGAPVAVTITGAGIAADPAISPDERVLVYTNRATDNTQQLNLTTRSSPTGPFDAATRLSIDLAGVNDADADLAADGCSLVFSSDRPGGAGGKDLWIVDVAR